MFEFASDRQIYDANDPEILKVQRKAQELMYDYNATRPDQQKEREELCQKMFAHFGEHAYIEPPFRANWGGKFVSFGKYAYANFNLTLTDDGEISIGDYTMIGPNVTIVTAGHPIRPDLREKGLQYNIPVIIKENVWIGAGAVILPGVTIGKNAVVGAGSVVTKDVPENTVVVGNPARVLREIGEHDRQYYWKELQIPEKYM